MLDFSIYLLYRAGLAVIGALPLRLLFRLGGAAGFFCWLFLGHYRRLARHNVAIAFGDGMSDGEMRRLVRRSFQRLGANLLCTVKMTSMPLEAIGQHVEMDIDVARAQERAGRSAVVVLSHLGNWEALAQLLPTLFPGVATGAVYQRLRNRHIDEHIRTRRRRAGLHLFDRAAGFGRAVDLLRDRAGIGVLSDQHAGDKGVWTPFFGRLASTTTLPALLAKRSGASILAATVQTTGVARWRMTFTPPFDTPADSVESLTAKANRVIEQQIRAAPEDWFWVHNRWKTPKPNFLLTRYRRGVYLSPEITSATLKPFRILIRSSNWLGDAIMSMPAVRAIKHGRPDAHITVLTPPHLAPVWQLAAGVDQVIVAPARSLLATSRLIKRQPSFDAAVLFPNSLRVALEVWLAGVPRRLGYRGHTRKWLLNQIVSEPIQPAPPEHQSRRYLRIACELGTTGELDEFGLDGARSGGEGPVRLGLCPGAEYGPAKRWLPERFAQAAAAVSAERDVHWILFGTKKDTCAGVEIADALGARCTNLIGQTTMEELIARLRECRLLLTNDTGTMHLAALLNVPVVAVFGSTEPRLTGPLGKGHRVIRHHVECSPCFLRECPIDFRCMHAVSTREAVDAISLMLGGLEGGGGGNLAP